MPVDKTDDKITLTHPSGSSAEILLYGATVISWRAPPPTGTAPPSERLYTSRTAALDGSKPVRGGIPVVFPFFGPPSRAEHAGLAQHGFARSARWAHAATLLDDAAGVAVRFVLPARAPYPALAYVVTLAAHQLTTTLHLDNPATGAPLTFQALLHTYLRAAAPNASVTPLEGVTFVDKLQAGHPEAREARARVDVRSPTDAVYKSAGGRYSVDTGDGRGVSVRAAGLADVVVWNPGAEAGRKMADLEEGGWDMFVAVEPGTASYWVELAPGETWMGQQVLTTE